MTITPVTSESVSPPSSCSSISATAATHVADTISAEVECPKLYDDRCYFTGGISKIHTSQWVKKLTIWVRL